MKTTLLIAVLAYSFVAIFVLGSGSLKENAMPCKADTLTNYQPKGGEVILIAGGINVVTDVSPAGVFLIRPANFVERAEWHIRSTFHHYGQCEVRPQGEKP